MSSDERGAKRTAAACLAVMGTLAGLALTVGFVAPASAAPAPVVLFVMQNKGLKVITPTDAPYMTSFAAGGRLFTNYIRPDGRGGSLRQGMFLTSGINSSVRVGKNLNDNIYNQIGDWQSWIESMLTPCQPKNSHRYKIAHNYALFYSNLIPTCPSRDLPYPDPLPATLAAFTQVTPNECSNTHNCKVSVGDAWLAAHVPPLLAKGAIVIITFDEGSRGDRRLWTAIQGPGVPAGFVDSTTLYSHAHLLAGLEEYFGLPRLTSTVGLVPLPIP